MAKRKPPPKKKAAGKRRQPPGLDWPALLSQVRLYALAFFLFSMPIFFLPGNTEYGYTKTIYTLVFVSALLALWGAEALLRRRWELDLTRLWPLLPGLVVAALISLAGGTPACVVIQSATLILYFGFVYLLVVNTSRGDREVALLLSALLAAGVLTGLYGLLQYLGLMRGGPGTGLNAVISTMGNRNYLGGFLAYIFFPSLILVFRLRWPWARGLALAGLGLVLAMALFVQQTGVRLGLFAGALVLAFGLGLWPASSGVRRVWPWGAAAAGVFVLAMGVVLGPASALLVLAALAILGGCMWGIGFLLRRVRWAWILVGLTALLALILLLPPITPIGAVRDAWARNSGRVRAWDWWVGYEMFRDHPLTGIGLGGYKISFVPYKADFLATPQGAAYKFPIARAAQAHNEYVQVAAELGLVGLLVLAAGIGLAVYLLARRLSSQEDPGRRLELLLLGAGLSTTFVHAGVSFPWHLPASSLAFVTVLGLALSSRYGPLGSFSVRLRGRALNATVTALISLGLVVSVIGIRDLMADRYLLAGRNALYLGPKFLLSVEWSEFRRDLDPLPVGGPLESVPESLRKRFELRKLWLSVSAAVRRAQETEWQITDKGKLYTIRRHNEMPNVLNVYVTRAKELLERAVALDFCPRISLYWLGIAHLQYGDLPAAQAAFRKCLSRYRQEPLYINLASVDVELGDYGEARALLEELLATRPNRDTELGSRYLLAVIDLKEGRDYVSAEQRLKEILEIDPRFERALILLGDIYRTTYRYQEAREYYQRALQVIDRKIASLERAREGPVTAEEYGAIRADLARLRQQREGVERSLAQLP